MSNKRSALLKLTDEVKKTLQIPLKVKKDRKQLESWMIDREAGIANLEDEIETLKGAGSLDVDTILDKTDDLVLEKRRLQQGEELLKELFEEDYKVEEDK